MCDIFITMIQAFLVIRILETGNVFQEYGNDNIFKGVELLYSMEWGWCGLLTVELKVFYPRDNRPTDQTEGICFVNAMMLAALQ